MNRTAKFLALSVALASSTAVGQDFYSPNADWMGDTTITEIARLSTSPALLRALMDRSRLVAEATDGPTIEMLERVDRVLRRIEGDLFTLSASADVLETSAYRTEIANFDFAGYPRAFAVLPINVGGSPVILAGLGIENLEDLLGIGVQMVESLPAGDDGIPDNYPVRRLATVIPAESPYDETIEAQEPVTLDLITRIGAITRDGAVSCTALMLSTTVALTAAHCACATGAAAVSIGPDLLPASITHTSSVRQWSVFGGEGRCTSCAAGFCPDDFFDQPDVALALLETPWDRELPQVRLATLVQLARAQSVFWVGFGETGEGIDNLRRMSVDEDVIAADCRGQKLPERPCLTDLEAYTFTPGHGPCKADSGAPAFVTLEDGGEALALISSRDGSLAAPGVSPCGRGGINTLVFTPPVVDFIRQSAEVDTSSGALLAMIDRILQDGEAGIGVPQ